MPLLFSSAKGWEFDLNGARRKKNELDHEDIPSLPPFLVGRRDAITLFYFACGTHEPRLADLIIEGGVKEAIIEEATLSADVFAGVGVELKINLEEDDIVPLEELKMLLDEEELHDHHLRSSLVLSISHRGGYLSFNKARGISRKSIEQE